MERIRSGEKQNRTLDVGKVGKKLGKIAAVMTLAATVGVASKLDKEVGDTDRIKDAEIVLVDGLAVHGGPNVRRDPENPDNPEDSNIYTKISNGDYELNYDGEILICGEWCGFEAEKLAKALCDAECISEAAGNDIVKRDKDGLAWINSDYVDYKEAETGDTNANS